tara:strand:+ start:298 stop:480 length:183 start_codon:yes stop_codon:yes gene_type:complete
MATIKGVYKVLKQKQKNGEDIGMFGESFIEMFEKEEQSTTKEISVSFIKKKLNKNGNADS